MNRQTHWSDVLGNEMSAADVLRWFGTTRHEGETLAAWIEQMSIELWGTEHKPEDWAALARELRDDAAQKYGTVTCAGKAYTLTSVADFSNRVFVSWWGDAQEGEPYTAEFCADAVDDEGTCYIVYWQFDTVKEQEPADNSNWPWGDDHITRIVRR